jgi:hypothetical protein
MAALAAVRCAQRADESRRFQQIVGNSPALDWSVQRIRPYCSWENVWIVAATNQPFRERVSDIPLLVWHFVEKYGERMSKQISRISDHSMDALKTYTWPGTLASCRISLNAQWFSPVATYLSYRRCRPSF